MRKVKSKLITLLFSFLTLVVLPLKAYADLIVPEREKDTVNSSNHTYLIVIGVVFLICLVSLIVIIKIKNKKHEK